MSETVIIRATKEFDEIQARVKCIGIGIAEAEDVSEKARLELLMKNAMYEYKVKKKNKQNVMAKAYTDWLQCKLKTMTSNDVNAKEKHRILKQVATGPQDFIPRTIHAFDFVNEDGTRCRTKEEKAAVLERFLKKREVAQI